MTNEEFEALQKLILKVLTVRLLVILHLIFSFSLCCWAMYDSSWQRLATAALYSVAGWFHIHFKGD